jgi:membrane protein required for colicin V production
VTGSTIDLAVLAAVALAAILGASSGALRQLVQLAAVVAGAFAARHLAAPVAAGLGRLASAPVARAIAPAFLFLGVAALVSLVGGALLRGTAVARAVRGPIDRGLGALLGGLKRRPRRGVLLSVLALSAARAGGRARAVRSSQLVDLAARYSVVERVAPDGARRSSSSGREEEGAGAALRPRGGACRPRP